MASPLDRQVGLFIQELVSNSGNFENIASNLSQYLSCANGRTAFIKLVNDTFETCVSYGSNSVPIFAKLFQRLNKTTSIMIESKKYNFREALSSSLQRAMDMTSIALYAFRRKLPLMNEIFKMNLLPWSMMKSLINYYARFDDEIAFRYQVEIVRNVSMLIDNGTIPLGKVDDDYWRHCVGRIKAALESGKITDRTATADINNFFAFISRERHQWFPAGTRLQLKQEDARCLLSRPNANAVTPAPTPTPSANNSNLMIICGGNSDDEVAPPPLPMKKTIINKQPPPVLKLTVPTEIPIPPSLSAISDQASSISSNNSSGLVLNVDRPLPTPIQLVIAPQTEPSLEIHLPTPGSSLLLPAGSVETIMDTFIQNKSEDIQFLVETIKQVLHSRVTEQQVLEEIKGMLKVTFSSLSDFSAFTKCIGVIERLQNFELRPDKSVNSIAAPLTFRDLVSRCAVDTKPVQTKQHVDDFCHSFRLTNELYRIGVVRRDVFQVYVLRMTNTDCEAAYMLLFELMKNVDSLIDADIAHLTEAEANFWTASNARLIHALKAKRRFFDISFVRNVTNFLVTLSQKGGWIRKRQLPVAPSCASCSDEVQVKPEPSDPVPTTTNPPPEPPAKETTTPPGSPMSISPSPSQAKKNDNDSPLSPSRETSNKKSPQKEGQPEQIISENRSPGKENPVEINAVSESSTGVPPASSSNIEELRVPVNVEKSDSPVLVIAETNSEKSSNESPQQKESSKTVQENGLTAAVENEQESAKTVPKSNNNNNSSNNASRCEEGAGVVGASTSVNQNNNRAVANSSASSFHPVDGDVRALTKTLALVSRGMEPLKTKLKSIHSLFAFTSAIELALPKIFEQIVDEKTFKDATEACLDLWKDDYGRGKNFAVEFEQFCLKYVSGKNSVDFERLKQVLREKRVTTSDSQTGEAEQTANSMSIDDKLLAYEKLYSKRRIGCTRVIGRLFTLKHVNLRYMMSFCDALLGARAEHSFECLKQLLVDIGDQLARLVADAGQEDWWTAYFDELISIGLDAHSSEKLKQIVREIVLLKSNWPDVDSRRHAREKLTELLANLTPELLTRAEPPGAMADYTATLDQICRLVAQEFTEQYAQKFIEILINKINQTLVDASSNRPPIIDLTSEASPPASPQRSPEPTEKGVTSSSAQTPTPESVSSRKRRTNTCENENQPDQPSAKR